MFFFMVIRLGMFLSFSRYNLDDFTDVPVLSHIDLIHSGFYFRDALQKYRTLIDKERKWTPLFILTRLTIKMSRTKLTFLSI